MLDDLRNSASASYTEEEPLIEEKVVNPYKIRKEPFLGMTPVQRFIVALFFLLMVMILGGFLLIVFQKVYFPL